jgi:arsenite methyltransferase
MELDVARSVLDRYSDGAKEQQAELCCPVDYDTSLLSILPKEIVEKDYGCGDPSRYVEPDDVVLDLGSGGGKVCYMAAHIAGEKGAVIGVDMNDDMLALARKYQPEMAEKLGGDRVKFVKGRIQDLSLGLEDQAEYLSKHPIGNILALNDFQQWQLAQRKNNPMIADNSIDLVVSNCVLNLVAESDREFMLSEVYRVLKPGGRVAISDIISDSYVPEEMKQDSDLWSGCISGAFESNQFLQAFKSKGFHGVRYDKWDTQPWKTIEGIIFRSATLTASKPLSTDGACGTETVIYRGPFEKITDDSGVSYVRGEKTVVSKQAYMALKTPAYKDQFVFYSESGVQSGCCGSSSTSCC